MKKVFFTFYLALFCLGQIQANPVDLASAKAVGQKFAHATLGIRNAELTLVYTAATDRGDNCFYVFNVGETGFVIVSADDFFRPIVGYSDEGLFEMENMSPELAYYLETIVKDRSMTQLDGQRAEIAEEWNKIRQSGRLISYNGGKRAEYLIKLKWNQDYPYNYYCPPASGGPGGRVYAGCVACAMSMVMKYWDYPTCGQGTHSHIGQTIDFGQTTYDWANMPNSISGGSPQEQIDAVATLMYHCGMAVNMNYSANGSGAYSFDVPDAVKDHFLYGQDVVLRSREDYTLEQWQSMLKESFDKQRPLYYSGCSNSGCHAFVCDGYDDNNLFHFNWGWSGSGDGWFAVDNMTFSGSAAAVFNFVPFTVYNNAPMPPSAFTATANGDTEFSATLNWTNPTKTVLDSTLTAIDKVVVTRNGEVVYEETNVTPGAAMSYTDHYGLPAVANYAVHVVRQDIASEKAYAKNVFLGSSCEWTVNTTAVSGGWRNGILSIYDAEGFRIGRITLLKSGSYSQKVNLPKGHVYFSWQTPNTPTNISFTILDSANDTVFAFTGNSNDMPSGTFFEANNACGSGSVCDAPFNAKVTMNGQDAVLTWDAVTSSQYGFAIYRDGSLYAMAHNGNSFTDDTVAGTDHSYKVSLFCENGKSAFSNECSMPSTTECIAPSDFYYEVLNDGRVKLHWTKPITENLSGYIIYRKDGEGAYQRIKVLGSSATSHIDGKAMPEGKKYRYRITAYYQSSNCESSSAHALYHPQHNFLEVNKTIIPDNLVVRNENGSLVLSWEPARYAESYTVYKNGEAIATSVDTTVYNDPNPSSDWSCYTVTGTFHNVESSHSNMACISLTANQETPTQYIAIYPNPTTGTVHVQAEGHKEISVFNLFGQEVLRKVSDSFTVTLDLSHLSKGTYFIKTLSDKGSTTHKVALN